MSLTFYLTMVDGNGIAIVLLNKMMEEEKEQEEEEEGASKA